MTNEIISADSARALSKAIYSSKQKDLVSKLKETVIRRAYSGEYSASLALVSQGNPSLELIESVAKLFEERGYRVSYNKTIITLTWT